MFTNRCVNLFLLALALWAPQISARQSVSPAILSNSKIHLDVVVTPKSGPPVSGLVLQDFTVLDNGMPQFIDLKAVDGRQAPIEVILLIDAVNMGSREVAVTREEIDKFLTANGGRLAHPTEVVVLTEKGLQIQEGFTQDGSAISAALSHYTVPMHNIGSGAPDRFQISFQGFAALVTQQRERPGRKMIIWVSPGWPPLRDQVRDSLQEHLFGNVGELWRQLREGRITVYSIDPSAIVDLQPGLTTGLTSPVRPSEENSYADNAGRPVAMHSIDLTLPVIAVQTGGLALYPGNDIASDLQRCMADADAYYEISFEPAIADPPNAFHRLEIRIAKPGLIGRTRQGYYWQPSHAERLAAGSLRLRGADDPDPMDTGDPSFYANAHPYLDLPYNQLLDRIPELKTLQPAQDQQRLPAILQKMGRGVDDFTRNIGDLIAHEDVLQEKLDARGKLKGKERFQDEYLILHHGYEWGARAEYRMDAKGNRLGPIGLEKGYVVTSGFALTCVSFSTVAQAQSRFRYLGDQTIGSRGTYVLGFVQKPGEVSFGTTMKGVGGKQIDMLTQGILWIDQNNFQIIRMRTDLLMPRQEIRLEQATTEVTLAEVRLPDLPDPLWLPDDVEVYLDIQNHQYRNVHHYTNYRRYRVSVKIGAPQ